MKNLIPLIAALLSAAGSSLDVQAAYDADMKASNDAGVASVVVDPAKVFTQADIDAAVAKAVSAVPVSPSQSGDKIFSQADMDKAIADLKALVLAEVQKDESNVEALLK